MSMVLQQGSKAGGLSGPIVSSPITCVIFQLTIAYFQHLPFMCDAFFSGESFLELYLSRNWKILEILFPFTDED